MGVYYSVQYGWGLRIVSAYAPDYEDGFYEWVNDITPDGYTYAVGGDQFDGTQEAALVSPVGGIKDLLHTSGLHENFGVFGGAEVAFSPTEEHMTVLRKLADEHGVPFDIGWFVVSSVG
jgi:hypothetical protein